MYILTGEYIVHISNKEEAQPLLELSGNLRKVFDLLASSFWPGPLTIVSKASSKIPMVCLTHAFDSSCLHSPCLHSFSLPSFLAVLFTSLLPLLLPAFAYILIASNCQYWFRRRTSPTTRDSTIAHSPCRCPHRRTECK